LNKFPIVCETLFVLLPSRPCCSSVGTATELIAGSSDFDVWWIQEIFSFLHLSRPAWSPASPLWSVYYGFFFRGQNGRAWCWPPTPIKHRVHEWVELYVYSPSVPSWHVTGRFFISLYCHTFFSWLCYLVL